MTTSATPAPPSPRAVALAAMSGQTIEYYDFYIYGTVSAFVLGPLFFPSANHLVSTLTAFATFGVGFLARPLGAILFGHLGDRVGRKKTLVITLWGMGLATCLVGVLPVYGQAGVIAPIALVVLRFVQGICVGGEWGGATLLSVEHAPRGKDGFYGSFPQLGSPLGLLLSTAMILLVGLMPHPAFLSWGWRIPFLFSSVLLVIGFLIRARVPESPQFEAARETSRQVKVPLLDTLRTCPKPLLAGLAATFLTTGGYFLVNTFTITYATQELGLPQQVGLIGQIVTSIVQASLILVVGAWSMRRSPRLLATAAALLVAAWAFPFYGLMQTGAPVAIWLGQAVATVFQTGLWAVLPSLLAAQFPVHLRYTGISLSLQGSAMIGGFTPFIATYLLSVFHSVWSVAGLLAIVALVSAAGCWASRSRPSAEEAGVAGMRPAAVETAD
ncbi:MFS transporter [Amycolatopsis jejuensis]|uniref:MFS transporter n=1 Tax=Amycolatopsis jejuensis TaxID=330084 RepID=UPI0006905266|nr:MFS transporter [Amycolatopsis jejuensis]